MQSTEATHVPTLNVGFDFAANRDSMESCASVQATDSDMKHTYLNVLASTPTADFVANAMIAALQPNVTLAETQ